MLTETCTSFHKTSNHLNKLCLPKATHGFIDYDDPFGDGCRLVELLLCQIPSTILGILPSTEGVNNEH